MGDSKISDPAAVPAALQAAAAQPLHAPQLLDVVVQRRQRTGMRVAAEQLGHKALAHKLAGDGVDPLRTGPRP